MMNIVSNLIAKQKVSFPKVLVVDDEASIRFSLESFLHDAGYEVCTASDTEEAQALVAKNDFEAAIIDLMFPGGRSGFDVIEYLRDNQPFCETVLMTAYPTFTSAQQSIKLQVFAYLTKPFSKDEVHDTVARAVEKSRARKSREHRSGLFKHALSAVTDPLVVYDLSGRSIYVNTAFSRTFGFTEVSLLDESLRFIPEDDQQTMKETVTALLAGKTVSPRLTTRLTSDGSSRTVQLTVFLFNDDVLSSGSIIAVYKDVTQQAELEHQLVETGKLSNLGLITGHIAHELATPLQAIMGNAELGLEHGTPDEQTRKMLANILESADKIRFLRDMLIEHGRPHENRLIRMQPEVPLEEAAAFLTKTGVIKNLSVTRQYEQETMLIQADPVEMQQVYINLIVNAAHALENMPRKEILLQTSCDKALMTVDISVVDTGCGIDPELVEKIFEPYFTTRSGSGGTGLGLQIVRSIVQAHGGSVSVRSEPGRGARFTVKLPALKA